MSPPPPTPPQVVVALLPRYPLFGGWSTRFLFGWSMPLPDAVLRAEGGAYMLTALLGPAIQDVVVDELVVRVSADACARWREGECRRMC